MNNTLRFVAGLACACALTTPALAYEVSGKVLAVYHEPVTINTKVLDKVSVTISSCNPAGQLETLSYPAGVVSDDNSLGFIYSQLATASHTPNVKTPYMNMVNGYVTLVVNDAKVVQKTTFWGYNWECGKNIDTATQALPGGMPNPGMNPGMPGGGVVPPTQQVPQTQQLPTGLPTNVRDVLRQFGF